MSEDQNLTNLIFKTEIDYTEIDDLERELKEILKNYENEEKDDEEVIEDEKETKEDEEVDILKVAEDVKEIEKIIKKYFDEMSSDIREKDESIQEYIDFIEEKNDEDENRPRPPKIAPPTKPIGLVSKKPLTTQQSQPPQPQQQSQQVEEESEEEVGFVPTKKFLTFLTKTNVPVHRRETQTGVPTLHLSKKGDFMGVTNMPSKQLMEKLGMDKQLKVTFSLGEDFTETMPIKTYKYESEEGEQREELQTFFQSQIEKPEEEQVTVTYKKEYPKEKSFTEQRSIKLVYGKGKRAKRLNIDINRTFINRFINAINDLKVAAKGAFNIE